MILQSDMLMGEHDPQYNREQRKSSLGLFQCYFKADNDPPEHYIEHGKSLVARMLYDHVQAWLSDGREYLVRVVPPETTRFYSGAAIQLGNDHLCGVQVHACALLLLHDHNEAQVGEFALMESHDTPYGMKRIRVPLRTLSPWANSGVPALWTVPYSVMDFEEARIRVKGTDYRAWRRTA